MSDMNLNLVCYIEGRGDRWQALCVDLDIAVQGESRDEVVKALEFAVQDYLDYVVTLPEGERERLLARKMPLPTQLRLIFGAFWYGLIRTFRRKDDDGFTGNIILPSHA